MTSIVEELADWTKANAAKLSSLGVQVTESMHPSKASIGLVYSGIAVSFAVWEQPVFQTTLIIMNEKSGKTLVMDDKTPSDATLIRADLDRVIERLLRGYYRGVDPDPKLIIS